MKLISAALTAFALHYTDGSTRDAELMAGQVLFSDPVTHWAENTGSSTIRIVLVEVRNR